MDEREKKIEEREFENNFLFLKLWFLFYFLGIYLFFFFFGKYWKYFFFLFKVKILKNFKFFNPKKFKKI